MSEAEAQARSARVEKVQAASHDHTVVRFAAGTLVVEGDGFVPRETTTTTVAAKLTALGPTDDLIAAVLGLTDLAFLLRKDGSAHAAEMIIAAIGAVKDLVDDAVSTWPPEEAELAGLRSNRFAAFTGNTTTNQPAEVRAPNENEVKGGPLARMAAMNLASKPKKDTP